MKVLISGVKGQLGKSVFDLINSGLLSTKVLSMNDWMIIIFVSSLVVVIEEFRKFIVNSKIFAIGNTR